MTFKNVFTAPFQSNTFDGVFSGNGGGSPYLDGILDSVVFELDATVADSYGGSGTTWANLTESPADGAAQAAYNFTNNGFTFTGTAGDAGAYFLSDGNDRFDLTGAMTAFFNALHKTGGQDFSIVFAGYLSNESTTQTIFSTSLGGSSAGLRVIKLNSSNGNKLRLLQRSATGSATDTSDGAVPNETPFLAIISHNHTTNETEFRINSSTASTVSSTFTAAEDPSGTFAIGAESDGDSPMSSGGRIYAVAGLNEYLDNTKAAAIIAALEARHNRDYTP